MILAGDLRQRVTVQSREETSDGHDGHTEDWADVPPARRSAVVRALQGRDLERARQVDVRAAHAVTLRFWRDYPVDLDAGRARLVWHDGVIGDRILEIVEVPREIEHRCFLEMLCREAA